MTVTVPSTATRANVSMPFTVSIAKSN
jgi:hypothetical protein